MNLWIEFGSLEHGESCEKNWEKTSRRMKAKQKSWLYSLFDPLAHSPKRNKKSSSKNALEAEDVFDEL